MFVELLKIFMEWMIDGKSSNAHEKSILEGLWNSQYVDNYGILKERIWWWSPPERNNCK